MGDAFAVRETVKPSWCDIFKETRPFVGPLASPSMVACNPTLGLLRNLRFRNPDDFQARSLHAQPAIWEKLLSNVSHKHVDFMDVIKELVNVEQFLTHFKVDFKGKSFDSDQPPSDRVGKLQVLCPVFGFYFYYHIAMGVGRGLVGLGRDWSGLTTLPSPSPHVEPSKPRLCLDERYLNLWIKDLPFKLDHLSDLPRYVFPAITRQPSTGALTSMRKVVTSTFISTRRPYLFRPALARFLLNILYVTVWLEG